MVTILIMTIMAIITMVTIMAIITLNGYYHGYTYEITINGYNLKYWLLFLLTFMAIITFKKQLPPRRGRHLRGFDHRGHHRRTTATSWRAKAGDGGQRIRVMLSCEPSKFIWDFYGDLMGFYGDLVKVNDILWWFNGV